MFRHLMLEISNSNFKWMKNRNEQFSRTTGNIGPAWADIEPTLNQHWTKKLFLACVFHHFVIAFLASDCHLIRLAPSICSVCFITLPLIQYSFPTPSFFIGCLFNDFHLTWQTTWICCVCFMFYRLYHWYSTPSSNIYVTPPFYFSIFSMVVFLVTVIAYDWHLEYVLYVLYLPPLPLIPYSFPT